MNAKDLRYSVDADPLRLEVLRQSPRESDNGTLGGCIVDHGAGTTEGHHRRRVNNASKISQSETVRPSDCPNLRAAFLHVWECVFGHSKHLKNIASEDALGHGEIDLFEVRTHDLLRSVVDQDVNRSEPASGCEPRHGIILRTGARLVHVFLDSFLACVVVHQVARNE